MQCDICKIPLKSKSSLKTHLISKHGVSESSVFFWCELCKHKIHDQKKFTWHMKTHWTCIIYPYCSSVHFVFSFPAVCYRKLWRCTLDQCCKNHLDLLSATHNWNRMQLILLLATNPEPPPLFFAKRMGSDWSALALEGPSIIYTRI